MIILAMYVLACGLNNNLDFNPLLGVLAIVLDLKYIGEIKLK